MFPENSAFGISTINGISNSVLHCDALETNQQFQQIERLKAAIAKITTTTTTSLFRSPRHSTRKLRMSKSMGGAETTTSNRSIPPLFASTKPKVAIPETLILSSLDCCDESLAFNNQRRIIREVDWCF